MKQPKNVRNFWLKVQIDGRKSRIATGPVHKDGGFSLRILGRNEGKVVDVCAIEGMADEHGDLLIRMIDSERGVTRIWEGIR